VRHFLSWIGLILLAGVNTSATAAEPAKSQSKPLLLQRPALSQDQIVFAFAGDLWIVARNGGDARRLTTGPGLETGPIFSPDGASVAFSGQYEGDLDVYVVPAAGGVPRRMTYHPGPDMAVGWTPDGKNVLFRSGRGSYSRFERLYTLGVDGGLPDELPLPMGVEGAYSPDAERIAYVPFWNRRSSPDAYSSWKHYRGGKAPPIWITALDDLRIERIPRDGSNDFNPMWVGDRVYFLSDRDGPTTLHVYDTRSKTVSKVLTEDGPDILSASAGPGAIVFERLGSINLLDLGSGQARVLDIRVAADLPGVRPRFEKVATALRNGRLSPTGARALFEARGEILTIPAEKGDARNLTRSPGVADRDPAWSPDGRTIAYFSDASGEYALHLVDQKGDSAPRTIALGDPPSFFYRPAWSPDSKKIAYTDKRLSLWYLDVETGKPVKVDTSAYDHPFRSLDPVWSPDSRWLAYTRELDSHMRAVFVYSLEHAGVPHQITDGQSDALFAAFDKSGKYLYFTASTDVGPTTGWLDMSSMNRPVTRSIYVAVLRKDLPSPLAPESDEEKTSKDKDKDEDEDKDKDKEKEKDKDKEKEKTPEPVKIDLEGIDQRILALPIPPRNYAGLSAGKEGILFVIEAPAVSERRAGPPALVVEKFDLKTRKVDKLLDGVATFDVSADGTKVLYRKGESTWFIAPADGPPKPDLAALKLDTVEVRVEPKAEWAQMYREVWRIERDFLYDPGAHGIDLRAAERTYAPYLEGVASRADLNYLFAEMLGDLTIGHLYVGGGDAPEPPKVKGGLLGADYRIENGRYRIAQIYRGENWNPELKAPLTEPGVVVNVGDYLLAIDGKDLRPPASPDQLLEATAGKAVVLKVGPEPDGTGSRLATVVPVGSETALRNLAWIEANRRKVDALSQGRVAYVYLPDTGLGGFTRFNRMFFAQVGKDAVVLDERFNGGGAAADYFIDYLRRPLMNYWTTREGKDFTTPLGAIFGPKVMIINEFAGSGGDALPWYFRKAKLGPLVGTRTWGGLIGIYDYPPLIDGGAVTAPRMAFWNPEGTWDVENHGVAPDVAVELDPRAVRAGHDPQLERAVALVLEALKQSPPPRHHKPAYPSYGTGQE
jgi:tricorn protease